MIRADDMTRNTWLALDLRPRQERFAREYIVDLNAKQAAIRAGYSPKTAEVQGSRLLGNVKVQRAIATSMAERSKRTEVTADRVVLELARVAFSDLRRVFDENGRLKRPEGWDDDTAAAISSVDIATRNIGEGEVEYVHKIRARDKPAALEKLAKHLGIYADPQQQASLNYFDQRRAYLHLSPVEREQRLLAIQQKPGLSPESQALLDETVGMLKAPLVAGAE